MSDARVIHSGDEPWTEGGAGELFGFKRRSLSGAAGGRWLGCSLMELAPSMTAAPFRYRLANEEALYILEGEATLRLGDKQHRVRAGDYVALPVGPHAAHQITNTSPDPVRYLRMYTMREPDVVVYPDSDKVGVIAGDDPQARTLEAFFPREAEVDAYHREPGTDTDPEAVREAEEAAKEAELEERVDDEMERLKRKLGLE